ncbi:MAG: hypothetical protein K8J31_02945 [Anaerolineae bacterium]|nr:hypothetical protein [Anaerolineae bacterium]
MTLVEPVSIPQEAVRDPDDLKILAAAVGGTATHIVSGDNDLLTLGTFEAIRILTAGEFLEVIRSESE